MIEKPFENLLKSEIKKVNAFATKLNGIKTQATGWSLIPQDEIDRGTGFQTVRCEMCSNDCQDRELDVLIHVCLWDRRKSFCSSDFVTCYR